MLALLVYGLVLLAGQEVRIHEMRARLGSVNRQIGEIHKENEDLQRQQAYLKSNDYIKNKARSEFGLTAPGEILYIPVDR